MNKSRIKLDKKSGVYYRPDMGELHIIKEQSQYNCLDVQGKIVLDAGANIGAFSRKCIANGCRKVYCYEPHPQTFTVLRKNQVKGMKIYNKALMLESGEVDLFIHNKYPSSNSVIPTRGRKIVTVPAVSFWDVVERLRPQVIKIDVEGAEYVFMDRQMPSYVREVAIELHLRGKQGKEQALQCAALFSNWYFHRKFRFNWHITTLVISRDRKGIGKVKDVLDNQ